MLPIRDNELPLDWRLPFKSVDWDAEEARAETFGLYPRSRTLHLPVPNFEGGLSLNTSKAILKGIKIVLASC